GLLFALLLLLLLLFQVRTYLQDRQQIISCQTNIERMELRLNGTVPKRFTAEQIAAQQREFKYAAKLLKRDAFRWTVLFDRMEALLPRNVSIRSFSPSYKDGSLVLTGVAKKLSDLQKLLDNLYADSFRQVFLQSQRQIDVVAYDGQKKPAHEFSIRLEGVFQ
ncbi:MAG: PilN domain-containing protein, partial [Deltaproteobacteria bacterium]|nr:PilN domain-containing protein [Deltaproteobacteria bacterium]